MQLPLHSGDVLILQRTRSAGPARILVVEDEPDIAALVAYELTRAGYRVETVGTGSGALDAVMREVPSLIVLDRMLPALSGDEVLRILREDTSTEAVPVLMLTACREPEDRIAGLELGADDYLTKPFSPRELVLRAEAILRRIGAPAVDAGGLIHRVGPISVNVTGNQVTVDGEERLFTPTEFRLLEALIEKPGRTQSRTQLLERAWDLDARVSGKIQTRTVDMHVQRLRTKLGPHGDWIETVRGFGYRFRSPAEEAWRTATNARGPGSS